MKLAYLCVLALAALLILPPRATAEPRPYVSLLGGYTALRDSDAGFLEEINFQEGYLAGVAVGYDSHAAKGYADTRLEAEFTYRKNNLQDVEFLGERTAGDGSIRSQSLLVNAYCDFKTPTFVEPFVYFGLGAARINVKKASVAGVSFIDDDGYSFAYQFGAGLAFALTESLDLDLGYRLFRIVDAKIEDATDDKFSLYYETQNVYLGLSYDF